MSTRIEEVPVGGCSGYQVKVEYGVYKCMTVQEYNDYQVSKTPEVSAAPIIIIAILLAIAVLATIAYYYWFGDSKREY